MFMPLIIGDFEPIAFNFRTEAIKALVSRAFAIRTTENILLDVAAKTPLGDVLLPGYDAYLAADGILTIELHTMAHDDLSYHDDNVMRFSVLEEGERRNIELPTNLICSVRMASSDGKALVQEILAPFIREMVVHEPPQKQKPQLKVVK